MQLIYFFLFSCFAPVDLKYYCDTMNSLLNNLFDKIVACFLQNIAKQPFAIVQYWTKTQICIGVFMDRRQRKSREAIFNAFICLLSKKHYNKITVGEIIEIADIGRATFYSHFVLFVV